LAECRAEVAGVVRRLRNHPSILLWCGGNENHMGWDFTFGTDPTVGRTLFEETMPAICAELDPDRLFHPSSPFGGPVPNWPLVGDWHDYTTLTFSPHASVPLYASEIGRVSAPSVTSMRRFLSEAELWPADHDPRIRTPGDAAWPPMWQYRSVDGAWDKVGSIEKFCDPVSAEDLVRVLGTAHGEYLYDRVVRHRRGVPDGTAQGVGSVVRRCWGTTIWRLNDPWPIIYWSAIDAYDEPKIAYYFLRRAYAPLLLCFERTPDMIAAWIVNDGPVPVEGALVVRRARFSGEVLGELSTTVSLQPGEACRGLEMTPLGPINLRSEFLWAELVGSGERQTASLLLIGERYLHLPEAQLSVAASESAVEISTDVFARQVTLTMEGVTGAVYEDNYFDMVPGQHRRVAVLDDAGGKMLQVRALNATPSVLSWGAGPAM
jgi:hypothetical protein